MNESQRQKFLSLVCQLSPENLSCDGELSRAEIQARQRAILRDWSRLEKEVGRKVTETEVYAMENNFQSVAADEKVSEPDDSMDGDLESGLRDAGLGTDEDYGGGTERI